MCVHIYVYTCMDRQTCIHIYIYSHIYIYVPTCSYTYTNTYIHTQLIYIYLHALYIHHWDAKDDGTADQTPPAAKNFQNSLRY